jgi:hypothetical protein
MTGLLNLRRLACAVAALAASAGSALTHGTHIVGVVVEATADQLEIEVVDATTSEESSLTFSVGPRTRVKRGDDSVPYARARPIPGEQVSVASSTSDDALLATLVHVVPRRGR